MTFVWMNEVGSRIDRRRALRSKMDHGIDFLRAHQVFAQLFIADVSVDKGMALWIGQVFQVLQVPGISQGIQVVDVNVRVCFQEITDEIAANEPGSPVTNILVAFLSIGFIQFNTAQPG